VVDGRSGQHDRAIKTRRWRPLPLKVHGFGQDRVDAARRRRIGDCAPSLSLRVKYGPTSFPPILRRRGSGRGQINIIFREPCKWVFNLASVSAPSAVQMILAILGDSAIRVGSDFAGQMSSTGVQSPDSMTNKLEDRINLLLTNCRARKKVWISDVRRSRGPPLRLSPQRWREY
jgi:hypothetical protein